MSAGLRRVAKVTGADRGIGAPIAAALAAAGFDRLVNNASLSSLAATCSSLRPIASTAPPLQASAGEAAGDVSWMPYPRSRRGYGLANL
jgi:NAD(P)-dependent dehydrogenase (short-subunit alcohol dehydrogenase family)